MKTLSRFLRDDRGTETVEWAIMGGLIAAAAITIVIAIGVHVKDAFTALDEGLDALPQ